MESPFIGEIACVAFDFAPPNWFPCDGRLLPIAQYQVLFALIGTRYGGDGKTNFAIPKMPSAAGAPIYLIAAMGLFPQRA